MNKAELVEAVASATDSSKASVDEVLNATIATIIKTVTKGDSVQLVGFGTFGSGKRAARTGRNPRTGETIKIAAARTVKFTAGKAFKDAVNKKNKARLMALEARPRPGFLLTDALALSLPMDHVGRSREARSQSPSRLW